MEGERRISKKEEKWKGEKWMCPLRYLKRCGGSSPPELTPRKQGRHEGEHEARRDEKGPGKGRRTKEQALAGKEQARTGLAGLLTGAHELDREGADRVPDLFLPVPDGLVAPTQSATR